MIHEHAARSRSNCCAMVWYVFHLWCSGYTVEVIAPDAPAALDNAHRAGHLAFMWQRGPAA